MARHRSDAPVDQLPPGRRPHPPTPPTGVNAAAVERDDRGASSIEHGLFLVAVAAVVTASVYAFGGVVKGTFDTTCTALTSQPSIPGNANCQAPAPADPDDRDRVRDLTALDPLRAG